MKTAQEVLESNFKVLMMSDGALNSILNAMYQYAEMACEEQKKIILKEYKKKYREDKFTNLILSEAEQNSSTPESAREYLKSEGIDPDKIASEGIKKIEKIKERRRHCPACKAYARGIKSRKAFNHTCGK